MVQRDIAVGDGRRRFFAPASVASLADALAANTEATLLAGGTDVGLWVTKQYRELEPVIYTGRVGELRRIRESDSVLEFGAAVTLTDAVPVLLAYYPDLQELFLRWASPPIRNAATLAGNIANGSPIGDSMPALMAVGASVVLRKGASQRLVPLEDFYIDYQVNDLAPGEFVEAVRVPMPSATTVTKSYKISKRFDQDITAVCLGASFELDDGIVRNVRLVYGGMAATIQRAVGAEQALEGRPLDDDAVAGYRRTISRNLLKRLKLDVDGNFESVYRYGRAS